MATITIEVNESSNSAKLFLGILKQFTNDADKTVQIIKKAKESKKDPFLEKINKVRAKKGTGTIVTNVEQFWDNL